MTFASVAGAKWNAPWEIRYLSLSFSLSLSLCRICFTRISYYQFSKKNRLFNLRYRTFPTSPCRFFGRRAQYRDCAIMRNAAMRRLCAISFPYGVATCRIFTIIKSFDKANGLQVPATEYRVHGRKNLADFHLSVTHAHFKWLINASDSISNLYPVLSFQNKILSNFHIISI